jgi:hypothetical protein
VAWNGHVLIDRPLDLFQSNRFWPLSDTLAYSDALVGYAPAGLVGEGPQDAIGRHNVLFLCAYALALLGAYVLGREAGLGMPAAAVCAAAFAFAPLRLEQEAHLAVVSSGGIPLAFALALRGYRLRSGMWVVAGFAVAAWQISLGFTLGVPFVYLLAAIALIAAGVWIARRCPRLPRNLVAATTAGALLFAAAAVALARPYERVLGDQPNARSSIEMIEEYSALFPGLLVVLLAIGGLWAAIYRPSVRIGLGLGALLFSALALGFRVEDGWAWPYRIAYEVLPGWDALRTPEALATYSSLALALLAGAGAEGLRRAWVGLSWMGGIRGAKTAVAVLAIAVAVEGRGLPFDPTDAQSEAAAPKADTRFADISAPQLHLPALRPADNRRYLLWSADGFPEMINGSGEFDPIYTAGVIRAAEDFPDARTVADLRARGVRTVVLHTDRLEGTPWAGANRRPYKRFGVTRSRRPFVLVYELGPS